MSELALVAQWVLAAVFTVSGVAKLRDRPGTAEAFAQFGVPKPLRGAAPVLPVVELLIAASLLIPATARWGAVAALALLVVLTGAIAVNLARGNRPDCNCFGRMGAGPIGTGTVVRNAVLIALAVVAAVPAAAAPSELFDRLSGGDIWVVAALAVMALAVAALGLLVIQLWLQQGRLLLRIDALESGRGAGSSNGASSEPNRGPAVGSSAPDLDGADDTGRLSVHWSGQPDTLLVFSDPNCAACHGLYPDLARWQSADARRRVVVVTRHVDEPPHADLGLFIEVDLAASAAYGVRGTPSAVLVSEGKVASTLAEGADAVRAMLSPAPAGVSAPVRMSPRPARVGSPLPELPEHVLRRVEGSLPSPDHDERPELMLFWNEGCGHCRTMVDGLHDRAQAQADDGPKMVFVVSSDADAQAVTQRLPSAAAMVDSQMALSMGLGVPGTPSAVLVGTDRRLRSDLAIGPDAIFSLLDDQNAVRAVHAQG